MIEIQQINSLPLPKTIELNTRKSVAQEKFDHVLSQWKLLSSQRFEDILLNLKSGRSSAEDLLFLKDYRKKSDMIRRLFQTNSKQKVVPKTFEKFVVSFGKLNDAIENNQTDIIRSKALEIRSMDKKSIRKDIDSFDAAPSRITKKTAEKLFDEIGEKANPDIIDAKAFHELRKELKTILSHFTIMHELYPEHIGYRQTFEYLIRLNDAMGVVNDTATAISLSGKEKYKSLRVEISQELSLAIEKALQRIKLVK